MSHKSNPPLSRSSKPSALAFQQPVVQASASVHDRFNANTAFTRPSRDACANLKLDAINPVASPLEDHMIRESKGHEAGVRCACQWGIYLYHLYMGVFEAEFQWDWHGWQKLIFYYYADHYVNFKDLVNDLYKPYKVRLWMSAVNPASFSPNAINQPPTGIGPDAITWMSVVNILAFLLRFSHAYGLGTTNAPSSHPSLATGLLWDRCGSKAAGSKRVLNRSDPWPPPSRTFTSVGCLVHWR